jgi:hypothetical protein
MLSLLQEVFNRIIILRFIRINNGTIWKCIGIILQSIDLTKAARGEETCHGLSSLGDHAVNLSTIKIPFLAGLITSKIFSGVYL